MFGGGGGMNPRKMQQMMEQMGIDIEEVDATEVVIHTEDGDDGDDGIPEEDVELVATRTGASREAAREALEAADGDLAAAVDRLE